MLIGKRHTIEVASRYFLAPINTGFCADGGAPDSRLIEFHRRRSGQAIGISLVGNVAIGEGYRSNANTLFFAQRDERWEELSRVIRDTGSIPGVQLACRLPAAVPALKWRNRAADSYIQSSRERVTQMTRTEILDICYEFVRAAEFAAYAGFKTVQIHAAHGYFLSQLMTRSINTRADEFGCGGVAALDTIIRGIRGVAPDLIVDVRVSLRDGIGDVQEEKQTRSLQIAQLVVAEPDIISLSAGHYEMDRFLIYPTRAAGYGPYLPDAVQLAKLYPDTLWNVAGNFWHILTPEDAVPDNLSISVGRSLIADPEFVHKELTGDRTGVTACVRSGHCHYFSRGRSHIECKVNEAVGA